MESAYSVVAFSMDYDSKTKKKNESLKGFGSNAKGNKTFFVQKSRDGKVLSQVEGVKKCTSKKFKVHSKGKKADKKKDEEVYKMLKKEFGMEYDALIKQFLKSKDYKSLVKGQTGC
jgi:hypothetical protein